MKKYFAVIGVVAALWGCAHHPANEGGPTPEERAAYEQGLRLLSRNDFESAQRQFAQVLLKFPSPSLVSGALYNEGLAFEGLRNYESAALQYKKIIEYNQSSNTRETAEAMYRLSICYEALGDDAKMILALLDLNGRVKFISKKTADVEVPARLAAAYARQGNLEQAEKYYTSAEEELKRWRRTPMNSDILVWLPKTLYSMGHTLPLKKDVTRTEFSSYLRALEKTQSWLVRSAELGNNPWSKKAAYEIEDCYQSLWEAIDKFRVADETDGLHAAMEKQKLQREMATDLDSTIEKLKLERLPPSSDEPEPEVLAVAFGKVNRIGKKVSDLLLQPDVRDQNTAESQSREGLKKGKGP